jgi:transcriptional regulator with XRE-family HTH domain
MNRIEEILKERGIKKAEFAELMNTSRQNINSLFKNPTNSKLKEIATALDVPIWQLFASPEDVAGKEELTALIRFRGQLYQADSIGDLENVVKWIREEGER